MMQVASCNRHFNYLLVFFFLKTQDHELEQALFVMADGVIMMVTYGTNNRMADDPRCDSKKNTNEETDDPQQELCGRPCRPA